MSSTCSEATAIILQTLRDKLPDQLLCSLFPDQPPGQVRQQLTAIVQQLSPLPPPTSRENENNNLSLPATTKVTAAKHLILYTDGASRGNPGLTGAGIQILNLNRQELIADSKFLGTGTNNEAEYKALILGLSSALELGAAQLDIFLDSELIVRQVQGIYKVKNARLKPLFEQVHSLLSTLKSFRIEHVPRSRNLRADELANRGIDQRKVQEQ